MPPETPPPPSTTVVPRLNLIVLQPLSQKPLSPRLPRATPTPLPSSSTAQLSRFSPTAARSPWHHASISKAAVLLSPQPPTASHRSSATGTSATLNTTSPNTRARQPRLHGADSRLTHSSPRLAQHVPFAPTASALLPSATCPVSAKGIFTLQECISRPGRKWLRE